MWGGITGADEQPGQPFNITENCDDGAELVAYLEAMLEGSLLCAVWEVSPGFS